jgi:hypothetical protein
VVASPSSMPDGVSELNISELSSELSGDLCGLGESLDFRHDLVYWWCVVYQEVA